MSKKNEEVTEAVAVPAVVDPEEGLPLANINVAEKDAEAREFLGAERTRRALAAAVSYAKIEGTLGASILAAFAVPLLAMMDGVKLDDKHGIPDTIKSRFNGMVKLFRDEAHRLICEYYEMPTHTIGESGREKRTDPPNWSSVNQYISTCKKILTSDKGSYSWGDILEAAGIDENGEDAPRKPGAVDSLAKEARGTVARKKKSDEEKLRELVVAADPEVLLAALVEREDFEALAELVLDTRAALDEADEN